MPKTLLCLFALIFSSSSIGAQELTVKPAVDATERWSDYSKAVTAWRETSKNLEKDFLRQSPEKAMKWIDRASEKAAAMVVARDGFYQALISQIRSQISLVHPAQKPQLADLRRLNTRALAGLNENRKLLEKMRAKDDGNPETLLMNEQIERQISVTRQLADNLRNQTSTLDVVEETSSSLSDAKTALLQNLAATLQLLEKQAELDRAEAPLWQTYYGSLKEIVTEHKIGGKQQESRAMKE